MEGICSHFASAEAKDGRFAELQMERFLRVITECRERGVVFSYRHMANSAAVLRCAAWDLDAVRPGILLYGYPPGTHAYGRNGGAARDNAPEPILTRPFLQWKTRILQIRRVPPHTPISYDSTYTTGRETYIATLAAGYADGVSRQLGNRGEVLIGGRRRRIVGRVTMDLMCVDLGPERCAEEGDEAVLLGEQGDSSIWADEVAVLRGTISYEVLTGIRTEDRRVRAFRTGQ
jgi:alanine racemase